jgi:phosphonate degradation associated HDIG domain protein
MKAITSRDRDFADQLLRLWANNENRQYSGEPVTHGTHALQAAWLARQAGASDALVIAALLHDLGHWLADDPVSPSDRGVDDAHESSGAAWLSQRFDAAVCAPIALHVAAKRFLCRDPAYLSRLSDDSRRSLALQGGVMDDQSAAVFETQPGAVDAVRLRRWDDEAKRPGWQPWSLEEVWPLIDALLSSRGTAAHHVRRDPSRRR